MKSREDRISLEALLKRSWPALLFGVLFCVGLSLLIFQFATHGTFRVTDETAAVSAEEHVDATRRLLDGVPVEEEDVNRRVMSVMIDNTPDAYPLAGPAHARLVIEAPVEGGITRLLVMLDAASELAHIGPVRSARPYFVEWASAIEAVYAHVGGSPDGLQLIREIENFRNLDEFSNPYRFERDAGRFAPHNVFTSMEELSYFADLVEWETSVFTPWAYSEEVESGDVMSVNIPYGGPFSVGWEYDAETKEYLRRQGGRIQKDEDGTEVRVQNVVVLLTSATVLDDVGRLNMRTKGEGAVAVFRDGRQIAGTWSREAGEWIRFEDMEGNAIPLAPGKTWISVVTSKSMFPE